MDAISCFLKILFGLSFVVPYLLAQDITQCSDSGSDWYTSVVGETPCRTYERLRQICNSDYTLGALNPNTPPDTCDDQVAECCCNSIAFGLSMLCLTCQQGVDSSGNGINAPSGTYQRYLTRKSKLCTPNTNQSFTVDIQAAVCNNDLKIHDDFYNAVFWSSGAWFYTWSRERMELTNAEDGNNSFTHCASTTLNVTSSTSQPQRMPSTVDSTATSTSVLSTSAGTRESSISTGAIAGIVTGCIAFTGAIMAFLLWLLWYHPRQAAVKDSGTSPPPFLIRSVSDDASFRYENSLYSAMSESSEGKSQGEKGERALSSLYAG
ncbi:uncharacterized protein BT62DRAFT_932621 [Guyanagaster necrorhizus]|uniref:Uncharacterized protein n=1 Tax=Guyanagaster necrorhizus TaxID=856835 RepID=A0A9P7VRS4_9AGAR|nr:uncharacterized protein BT62DRAFT_932621 [Guyanagaster necrorhizus MCA 3950]KAG7445525.1 hypothetical protein BT62DRAFT_932621 [Guyanagaster necrorhizus MCA 3950]